MCFWIELCRNMKLLEPIRKKDRKQLEPPYDTRTVKDFNLVNMVGYQDAFIDTSNHCAFLLKSEEAKIDEIFYKVCLKQQPCNVCVLRSVFCEKFTTFRMHRFIAYLTLNCLALSRISYIRTSMLFLYGIMYNKQFIATLIKRKWHTYQGFDGNYFENRKIKNFWLIFYLRLNISKRKGRFFSNFLHRKCFKQQISNDRANLKLSLIVFFKTDCHGFAKLASPNYQNQRRCH